MEAQKLREEYRFGEADVAYARLKTRLSSGPLLGAQHDEVERVLGEEGRALLRELMQSHITLRGLGDTGPTVTGGDGVTRTHRRVHERALTTVFGPVRVRRMGYRTRGLNSLYPVDAALNLPRESYSHGMRLIAAREASKASFHEVGLTIERTTGVRVPHRQIEDLALRAATDFDAFYEERQASAIAARATSSSILVLSADGKGVVMRPEALREATRKAAAVRTHKMGTRLSPGEKRNAKRMAEVATVYSIAPYPRTPEQIVRGSAENDDGPAPRPRPEHKRVWASIEQDTPEVIDGAFREALSRDPTRVKRWVALVDGNAPQIEAFEERARHHKVKLTIVLDVIHVIEYLWGAVAAFETLGTAGAEAWVSERLLRILHGQASDVAAGMRRSATKRGLSTVTRKPVDRCAKYLRRHARYLRYDEYLADGLPIGTGVIEGACRYLVKDRMDITGARWTLSGAEAVLRLRALHASHDFDAYWTYHVAQEHLRNHLSSYADHRPPATAAVPRAHARDASRIRPVHLRLMPDLPAK